MAVVLNYILLLHTQQTETFKSADGSNDGWLEYSAICAIWILHILYCANYLTSDQTLNHQFPCDFFFSFIHSEPSPVCVCVTFPLHYEEGCIKTQPCKGLLMPWHIILLQVLLLKSWIVAMKRWGQCFSSRLRSGWWRVLIGFFGMLL